MYTENLIYKYIPWQKIVNDVGIPYICEFGCGNLRYLDLYDEILGEGNYYYLGIEAPGFHLDEATQAKLSDKVRFINHDLNHGVPEEIEAYDLFLSFSVLEHIDNLERMLDQYSRVSKPGSFHFHSVPTFLSVINYLWHGCRHFNTKDINQLAKVDASETEEVLYYGGAISILLHFVFITSLDLFSKVFYISGPIRSMGDFLARSLVSRCQVIDDATSYFGIHSFAMVSWSIKCQNVSEAKKITSKILISK
jgi:SAM-dependent methyltransferase